MLDGSFLLPLPNGSGYVIWIIWRNGESGRERERGTLLSSIFIWAISAGIPDFTALFSASHRLNFDCLVFPARVGPRGRLFNRLIRKRDSR